MTIPGFQPPQGIGPVTPPAWAQPGHPPYPPNPSAVPPRPSEPPQRPALVGMSTMMTVTAAMLFMAALGFLWMVAWAGNESIDYTTEGGLYYVMERFHLRLAGGLWVPLFGLPTLSIASAFCLLGRLPWARIVHSALGLVSVGWLVITWHRHAGYIAAPIVYIAFCVAILWVRPVSTWLSWTPAAPADPVRS